jgi:hypothetical protein
MMSLKFSDDAVGSGVCVVALSFGSSGSGVWIFRNSIALDSEINRRAVRLHYILASWALADKGLLHDCNADVRARTGSVSIWNS